MRLTVQDCEPATRAQIGYIVGLTHDYTYLDKEMTKSEAGRKIRDCLKVKKYLQNKEEERKNNGYTK